MKPINIIIYLAMIAVFEGAFHEYIGEHLLSNVSQADRGIHHVVYRKRLSVAPKKESVATWYDAVLYVLQGIWSVCSGVVRWIWHWMKESLELTMMVFEETELFKDVITQCKAGGGSQAIH